MGNQLMSLSSQPIEECKKAPAVSSPTGSRWVYVTVLMAVGMGMESVPGYV